MAATSEVTRGLSLVTARIVSAIAAVRPGERRLTLGALLTLSGFMSGHALLETARDALFLGSWPASQLPWAYLIIAVVALAITQMQDRLLTRFRSKRELSTWLGLSATITLGFWIVIDWAGGWVLYALYVWSGVLATLVVVRFWTVLGNLFTVTQAKRLFAVVGSGSVVGAIFGSAVARVLSSAAPPRHLVLAAAVAFFVSSMAPRLIAVPLVDGERRREPVQALPRELAAVARFIWMRPYLFRVAAVILLGTITFTFVDYVFKSTVDRTIPADQMGAFFSTVYLALNVASLVVQVFVVTWLVRRIGINTVQGIVPALLFIGAVGYVVSAGIVVALILKSVDGSLRHSLYRTGTELLFVPMSVDVRGRVKALIDVVGQRGGQALASLTILLLLAVTTRESLIAAVAGITALFWFLLAIDLRTHYVNVFRESLREDLLRTRLDLPALDVASFEALLRTLNESDDRRVVAALDLLDVQGKIRVVPALILYHPSPRVVVRAMELFVREGRHDCVPILQRLVGHPDEQVGAAALTGLSVLRPNEDVLRQGLASKSQEIEAAALVGLMSHNWIEVEEGMKLLGEIVENGTQSATLALATALRHHPARLFEVVLVRLAESASHPVQLEAIRAMATTRNPGLAPTLIRLLGVRALREEIRSAIAAIGPPILPELMLALGDQNLPHTIRRHIPMTVAAMGTPRAADQLLQHVLAENDGMIRFKCLRALGRLRADHPGLPLDEARLAGAFDQTLQAAFELMRRRHALEFGANQRVERKTPIHDALVALLRDKEVHAIERLFRLLNLITNDEDLPRVHRGFKSVSSDTRARSRELIEHLVVPRFRSPLLTLIDDLYDSSTAVPHSEATHDNYESELARLAEDRMESLSAFALGQIAALSLKGLLHCVHERPEFSSFHSDIVRRTRMALTEQDS